MIGFKPKRKTHKIKGNINEVAASFVKKKKIAGRLTPKFLEAAGKSTVKGIRIKKQI